MNKLADMRIQRLTVSLPYPKFPMFFKYYVSAYKQINFFQT